MAEEQPTSPAGPQAATPTIAESAAPEEAPLPDDAGTNDQADIDELLKQAAFEDPPAIGAAAPGAAAGADALKLTDFNQVIQEAQVSSIDLLRDVELNVKIEL